MINVEIYMYLPSSVKCLKSVYIGFFTVLIASLVACGGGSSSSSSSSTTGPTAFYAVTNTNDSGAGSLREAITSVNASSSTQYSGISFAVTGVITLASDLPAITKKVLIDGGTAPGYVAGNTTTAPLVAVNFANAGSGFNFNSGSAGSGIYALSIYGSNSNGITLNASNITLLRNYIGLNLSGAAGGNAADGIYIAAASINNVIGSNPKSISGLYSNVISGNTLNGIRIYGSAGNQIQANAIGTNPAGTSAIGNRNNGILVTYYATENTIGGTAYYDSATGQTNDPTGNKGTVPIVYIAPPLGNLISGNTQNGVHIDQYSELTALSGNFIGTNNAGTAAIGNGWNGVSITNSNNNQLIGCTFEDNPFIYYNVLSGNGRNGLYIYNSNAILVQANFFGTAASNAAIVPNVLNGILVGGTSAGVQVGGVIPLGNVSAGNGVSGSGIGDGIRLEDTVSGFTTFNTFAGLFAFQGAAPNQGNGITVDSSGANNLIRTNVPSGNIGHGIELTSRATGVTVDPNVVGLNTYGTGTLSNPPVPGYGNGGSGIKISGNNNIIGGYNGSVIPQNTFSGNARYGVEITSGATGNYVFNASIGLATTFEKGAGFGNGLGGILIAGTGNFVGPTPSTVTTSSPVTAYISGNTGNGVTLTGSSNAVTGNYFGYAALITTTTPVRDQACNTGFSIANSGSNTVSSNNVGDCAP
jgi:parallel beta-helix repeat protein